MATATMEKSSQPAVDLKNPYLAALLAFLIPGLGHWYQGRRGKAVLYCVCILGLYLAGFVLGGGNNVFWRWVNPLRDSENFRLQFLGQFWVGLPGLLSVVQATLLYKEMPPLFNGFLAEPAMNVINAAHSQLSKLVDVGTVYTTIAGLLNVLAIYDAMEGPAHPDGEEATQAAPGAVGQLQPEPQA